MLARFLVVAVAAGAAAMAQIDVTTGGYSPARTNANPFERALTTSNVNPRQFGKLFVLAVDGEIYAQPLYLRNVSIAGKGLHNVVFVATMHNTVYAFDADTPDDPLWQVNLGPSVPIADYKLLEIDSEAGILSTPVIDPASGRLYVVADTKENGNYYYRLHALDVGSGAERVNGPVTISANVPGTGDGSVNGTLAFDPFLQLQRPALLLLNGVVYLGFGSHGDDGAYHGWLMGYDAQDVQRQTAVRCFTPNGSQGALWQAGRGPAADSSGYIYVVTANGTYDGQTEFSQSILKLNPAKNLAITDWFTISNWQKTSEQDYDLGSTGVAIVPGTHYVVTGDKGGNIYLADPNNLGRMAPGNSGIWQEFQPLSYGIFNEAVWQGPDGPVLYAHAAGTSLEAFRMASGRFETKPFSQSLQTHWVPYGGYSVSSNGTAAGTGIFWATTTEAHYAPFVATLRAFDATDLSKELWSSDMVPNRDTLGLYAKFNSATVANGKVYAPTFSNRLVVYGLLPQSGIIGVASAASFVNDPVAPREIVTIFGAGLGPATLASAPLDNDGRLQTSWAGTRVLFNGQPAPLIYVSDAQDAVLVPTSVAGSVSTSVQVEYQGTLTSAVAVPVAGTAPALFTSDFSGNGQGAVLNQDGKVNSPWNPAAAGSVVVLYATGEGMTSPPEQDTVRTSSPYPKPIADFSVTVGGLPAQILYAGPAPGYAGLVQINVRIAREVPTGFFVPVEVSIGGRPAPHGVTVAIQ